MPDCAAIIITPSDRIKWTTYTSDGWEDDIDLWCSTSEQLLADLRTLIKAGEWATTIADWDPHRRKENEIAAARVRTAIGDEDA